MSKIAISVNKVSKTFRLPHEKHSSLKSMFVNVFRSKRTYERQQVLKDISFDIEQGEFFGIVGRNGSGKSTLLKLLSGIYSPDCGSITVNGKLTPFIELGVGFNPELTGRENVYLNGALLGFDTKEMDGMYADIVDFAELADFMDQKLKNYSSGMQVRLAFAIAIRAKSDILLLDEVLAVGDEAFQRKCLDVFERYKAEKQTVVLVTHDMETVKRFCTRALVLDAGKILKIGEPSKIARTYSELNQNQVERDITKNNESIGQNELNLRYTYRNSSDVETSSYKCGDKIKVSMSYDKKPQIKFLVLNIYKRTGEHITGFRVPVTNGKSEVEVRALFSKGKYYTLVQAVDENAAAVGDTIDGPDFIITTDRAPDVEGWSGLVPVEYNIIES